MTGGLPDRDRPDRDRPDRDWPGRHWQEGDGLHIDVRGLDPPEPMVAILGQLDQPDQSGPVTVHHDRQPIYLFPELAMRGWTCTQIPGDPGEIRLSLSRDP